MCAWENNKETKKAQNLWFNDILWQQHKIVKNRARIWRNYGKQHHEKSYTAKRNKYNHQLHYFKQQSLRIRILDCKNNAKELFLLVNKLTGNTAQNPLPPNKTDEELAKDKYNHQLYYFKQQSLSKRILDCKNNAKGFFLLVNKCMGNTAQNPLPPNKTDEELAEDCARYFLSKIEKNKRITYWHTIICGLAT